MDLSDASRPPQVGLAHSDLMGDWFAVFGLNVQAPRKSIAQAVDQIQTATQPDTPKP